MRDAHDGFVEECLAGIDDIGFRIEPMERIHVRFHPVAQMRLVEDVERRSLLARQLHEIDTAHEQVAVAHLSGLREHGT